VLEGERALAADVVLAVDGGLVDRAPLDLDLAVRAVLPEN
jgi:hypothetical protein